MITFSLNINHVSFSVWNTALNTLFSFYYLDLKSKNLLIFPKTLDLEWYHVPLALLKIS